MSEMRELELVELGEVSVETKGSTPQLVFEENCISKRPSNPTDC